MAGFWRSGRARDGRRGQSVVEFAIASPIILFIMLGTLDLGRAYITYTDLKTAAREGAGYGQLHPTDYDGMETRALNSGVPDGTGAEASCSGVCSTIDGTGTVQVVVTYEFEPLFLGMFQYFGLDTFELVATAKMRSLT